MIHSLKIQVISILFLFFNCSGAFCQTSISPAYTAYVQIDPSKAYQLYGAVWEDPSSSNADRLEAGRMLSKMEWLFYQNVKEAISRLSKMEEMGSELDQTYALWSRILISQNRYKEAINITQRGLNELKAADQNLKMIIAFAHAVNEKSKYLMMNNEEVADKWNSEEIKSALDLVGQNFDHFFGDPLASKIMLGLALQLDQKETIRKAWLSYFRLKDSDELAPTLKKSFNYLTQSLDQKEGKLSQREALFLSLAGSGFYEEALMIANKYADLKNSSNENIQDYLSWISYLLRIKPKLDDFYRQTALGKENRKLFKKYLTDESKKVWLALNWEDKTPKFRMESFIPEVKKRFGTVIRTYTNQYFGIHIGHAIDEQILMVEQHGRQAKMQYVKVDHMLSNGYEPWFWDGKLTHGGWVNSTTSIFQVRLTDLALKSWERVHNPDERKKRIQRIEDRKSKDEGYLKKNPYSYLPGIHASIRFKSIDQLYQSLKKKDYSESELKVKFIASMERIIDFGVIQHEARHAIDKEIKNWKDAEFEFRAKLSEIYFSEMPFLTLGYGGVLSANIGDKSAHGQANLMIMKGLVEWMKKNQESIQGFDSKIEILAQLDLLSERQLKAAISSMDPLRLR